MQGKLVALEVPRGSGYDSQSGLNNLFPQVMVVSLPTPAACVSPSW
jgi:hypothetical protein